MLKFREIKEVTCLLRKVPPLALTVLLLTNAASLLAQTHSPEHPPEHPPMQKSAQISFAVAYPEALKLAPELLLSETAREQANTAQAVAGRWIVGDPAWQTSVINDRLLSDQGLRELETGVAVNLWRPGERRDALARGSAYQQRSAAIQHYLRWLVAGRLRSSLAQLELADLQLAAASQAEQDALRLLEITRGLQGAGAVPALDVLQAESLWLQQQQKVLDASAGLVDAERAWQVLTGMSVRPAAAHTEARAPDSDIPADHPLLSLRQSEILISERNITDAERNAKGSPSVSLGVRRERGDWRDDYIESIGVSVSIPITSRTVIAAGSTEARAARTASELSMLQDLRALTAQLHEIEHELFTLELSLPLSARQYDVNQRQWQMAQTAFEAGESDLTQVIMALQRAQDSNREHQIQLLRQQHLYSEYNQIIGALP